LWAAWDAATSNLRPRSLVATLTPGAGNAAGQFRGSWRVANCGDGVTILPFEALGYEHVDTLIQVNSATPLSFVVNSNASCANTPLPWVTFEPHLKQSYLMALGGANFTVGNDQLVKYKADSALWVAPGGALCSSISASQTPSQTPTTPVTPSTTPSTTGTPSPPPTTTSTPSVSPSSSLTPSVLPTPPGLSDTPSSTPSAAGTPSRTLAGSPPPPASAGPVGAGADASAASSSLAPTSTIAAVSASLGALLVGATAAGLVFLRRRRVRKLARLAAANPAPAANGGGGPALASTRNPLAAAVTTPSLPPGWREARDGDEIWYVHDDGSLTWTRPAAPHDAHKDSELASLPPGWREARDGDQIWFVHDDGTATWVRPAAQPHAQLTSPSHG
jgi:hypothetical protein